ncbi:MAG: hypothetical protein CFE21_05525 [Bacteroidetes bacterium B1(2017)]|nr:MAG: hypothetical protein CFE21_05525 [Bacteroidetes bacterium B1(2017)]
MNEDLLQYIWQNKYLLHFALCSIQQQPITIFNPGQLNLHSGPDFFNAKLKIGDTIWAGNVEIHIHSSDWYKHGHQTDKAYENVILHVVWENDQTVYLKNQHEIPTLELKKLIPESLLQTYQALLNGRAEIPCGHIFTLPEPEILWFWLERLSAERLELKAEKINAQLVQTKGNWEEVLYKQLALSFGQKVNAEAFEQVTNFLPYSILKKYTGNTLSYQAIILGVSGFLGHAPKSAYGISLQKEFNYLQQKHSLKTIDVWTWKFGKIRPANFPTIRVLQFAELMLTHSNLLEGIIKSKNLSDLRAVFKTKSSQKINIGDLHPNEKKEHWERVQVSEQLVHSIVMNVAVPMAFAYGKHFQLDHLCEKVQDWLLEIPAEENKIIKMWANLGLVAKKSKESQALLQLKNYYCNHNKCLQCAIGNHLLKTNINSIS